ncbi:MAG TPA: lysophospholipid acyltransferase family protein [Bacteroidia bacterium]|jgi:1-acyl-sn-glycerol-3-phosphate acyltransferase
MLYTALKPFIKITVRVFFRSITYRNHKSIPEKGPLLILANHPSTFMDPIVIAVIVKRPVYFLAKAAIFKTAFAKWILPKFHIIPLYRKVDDPTLMSNNEDTFRKCYEHLEKNGVILMFPEGLSITERKLRPIKSGAARIALGAEARNDFKLGVKIVNIGLNYVDPHTFNRDLFLNVDEPITVADYKEQYLKDSFKTSGILTEEIRTRLEKLVIAIDDDNTDKLVENIELLYKSKLTKESGSQDDKMVEFVITKNIIETVNYFKILQPKRAENIDTRIKQYLKSLSDLGLQDSDIEKNQKNNSFLKTNMKAFLKICFGFPFFIYGMLNNYIPFKLPGWIVRKKEERLENIGGIYMVGGMFSFMIFYIAQIILVWKFTHIQWLTIAYAVSLPISGTFAFAYSLMIKEIRAKWLLTMLFFKKSVLISGLISEREQLIAEFDKAREEYALVKTDF